MQLHFDPAAPETVFLPVFQILENSYIYFLYLNITKSQMNKYSCRIQKNAYYLT